MYFQNFSSKTYFTKKKTLSHLTVSKNQDGCVQNANCRFMLKQNSGLTLMLSIEAHYDKPKTTCYAPNAVGCEARRRTFMFL